MKKFLLVYPILALVIAVYYLLPPEQVAADIVTNLTAWYKMDTGSGTSILDSSGSGFTVTFAASSADPSWTTASKIGPYAVDFDGSDEASNAVQISSYMSASAGTVSMWAYIRGTDSDCGGVSYGCAGLWSDTGGYLGILVGTITTDQIWAYNYDGNEDRVGTAYSQNVWNHIVWTHGGGTLSLYLNGKFIGSTSSGDTGQVTNQFALGRNYNQTSFANAIIDDVRVFSRALTAADVAALYNTGMSVPAITGSIF